MYVIYCYQCVDLLVILVHFVRILNGLRRISHDERSVTPLGARSYGNIN